MSLIKEQTVCKKFDIVNPGIIMRNSDNGQMDTNGCFYLCAVIGKNPDILKKGLPEVQKEAFRLKMKLTTGDYDLVEFRRHGAYADENVLKKFAKTQGYCLKIYERVEATEFGWEVKPEHSFVDASGQKSATVSVEKVIHLGWANFNHYVILFPRESQHIRYESQSPQKQKSALDYMEEAFAALSKN